MPWWENAVVYQVYPRSFADSDNDGEGDLDGIRTRLSYLVELGVDAVWLSPFYPSPMADGGYDVSDYCGVDPRFGTLDSFDALMAEATGLDLRVIVDIVPNHCSSAHPLFQRALAAQPGSPERELFIFRDEPNNWPSFFGGSAWTQVTSADGQQGQWYLHLFDASQPDWNWRNPAVPAMFEEVLRFWLDRGAAGFRVDVGNALYKAEGLPDVPEAVAAGGVSQGDEGTPYQDQPELDDHYRSWRQLLDSYGSVGFPGERIMIGETWADDPSTVVRWIRAGMTQGFDFRLIGRPWSADLWHETIQAAEEVGVPPGASPWAVGNHDVPRLVTRLGIDQVHDLDGLRETLHKGVRVDLRQGALRARAAALIVLGLPGSAYVYQGDELGLPEYVEIPPDQRHDPMYFRTDGETIGRDGCRVPLPWSGTTAPYGFTGDAVATWLPQPDDWAGLTVEAQRANSASVWSLYRDALAARRDLAGPLEWEDCGPGVLAYRRGPVLVIANFSDVPVAVPSHQRVVVASETIESGTLAGNSAAWLEL